MRLLMRNYDRGEFTVWAMLDDNHELEPKDRSESFVIGCGASRDEAVDHAVRELKAAWEDAEALRAAPPVAGS